MIRPYTVEEFERLESAHGWLGLHASYQGPVLFRRPTREEVQVFFAKTNAPNANQNGMAIDAQQELVRRCVVYPDRKGLDAVMAEFVLFDDEIAGPILRSAKGDETARAKKPETPSDAGTPT